MKNKFVFKKHLLMLTIICSLAVAALECFFVYFIFNLVEPSARPILSIVLFIIPLSIVGLVVILFGQYLIINDETVTLCKLFKRVRTINWSDAALTETTVCVNGVDRKTVEITDGTQKISFSSVSDKDMALLKELCKTARARYNTDNLTF